MGLFIFISSILLLLFINLKSKRAKNQKEELLIQEQELKPIERISKEEKKLNEMKKKLIENQKKMREKTDDNITEKQKNQQINNVLEDMCIYGEITKKEIKEEKVKHPEKFINTSEALQMEKKMKDYLHLHYFLQI